MNVPYIRGVITPVITPFTQNNTIDFPALQQIIDFLLSKGIVGLMVAGSTGEGPLLSVGEKKALFDFFVTHVNGRVPILAHTGCINTPDTVELTRYAAKIGATAGSLITPYFFTVDEEALFQHYMAVAESAPDLPLFLYDFPGNAKNEVSPGLMRKLIKHAPNIVGVKSTNTSILRLQDFLAIAAENTGFQVYNGVDGITLAAFSLGTTAQISGNSNVIPELFVTLYQTNQSGQMEKAQSIQREINKSRAIFKDGASAAFFKAGLKARGLPGGYSRLPMREPSPEELSRINEHMKKLALD